MRESLYAISHSEKPINQKIDQSINHLSTVQYISWIPRAALNVTGGSQLLIQRELRYCSSLITILYFEHVPTENSKEKDYEKFSNAQEYVEKFFDKQVEAMYLHLYAHFVLYIKRVTLILWETIKRLPVL